MFIKTITLEYDDSIKDDRRTSSVLPLKHSLCQIYESWKWSKRSAFIYKINREEDLWNIEVELRHVLSSWRYKYPERTRYEIWICDVKNEFPIIQKNKIYILKASYLLDTLEQDNKKEEILQATEAHILSQGKNKIQNIDEDKIGDYFSEFIDISKQIYIDIRKSRGFISPEYYYHAESIRLTTLKIEGEI